ncbi:MAG: hypothetical protein OXC93_05045 [Rhodospirillaceae bacterium]|nr:hypothetical protein [Rhodospirillaceae bacterium]
MIAHDTIASYPTPAIFHPKITIGGDFNANQTEREMLQEPGSLGRFNAFRGEYLDVANTAMHCATLFVVDSSILENTYDQPSRWTLASQSRMSPTFRLIARLVDLFETPENIRWPSMTWPVKSAFEDARVFITKLPLAHIPEPEIQFADDGEINFLWIGRNVHIDLGFYGTGAYSYFGCNGDGQEIQDENVLVSEGLAQSIKNFLTA